VRVPPFDPPGQLLDGLGLVAPGLEVGDEPEGPPVDVVAPCRVPVVSMAQIGILNSPVLTGGLVPRPRSAFTI